MVISYHGRIMWLLMEMVGEMVREMVREDRNGKGVNRRR